MGVSITAASGLVVVRNEVGIRAGRVARSAGGGLALGVVGGDSEADLGEQGVGAHVDARQVPEDGGVGQGVLELQDVGLAGGGGHLDRDATAVGVDAPVLGVALTLGDGHHRGVEVIRHGPQIDGLVHVVVDGHTTTRRRRGSAVGGANQRERRGRRGQKSGNTEDLSELHFDGRSVWAVIIFTNNKQRSVLSGSSVVKSKGTVRSDCRIEVTVVEYIKREGARWRGIPQPYIT